jgi:hypothetical protein
MSAKDALLTSVTLALGGCYAATGLRLDSTTVQPKQVSEVTTRVTVDHSRDIAQRLEGTRLVFQVDDLEMCRDDLVQRYSNLETTDRVLPTHFWWFSGASVAVAGGGAALWGIGAQKVDKGESVPLGDAAHEKSLDRGLQTVTAGQIMLAVGTLGLTSALTDLWLARDESRELPETTKTIEGEVRECKRTGAVTLDLTVRVGGVERTARTDAAGRAIIDLTAVEFQGATFVEPLGTAKADGYHAIDVSADAAGLAGIVVPRGRRDELQGWLDRHAGDASAPPVEAALTAAKTRDGDRLAAESRAATSRQDYETARQRGNECLAFNADYSPCLQAVSAANRSEADGILAHGRDLAKTNDLPGASSAAAKCLNLIPDFAPCLTFEQEIAARVKAEDRWLQQWGEGHRWRASETARYAVSKHLRAPATAQWIESKVLAVRHNNYYVRVVVDAQNGFGVPIRNTSCVLLQLDMKSATEYRSPPSIECEDDATEEKIAEALQAMAELWPARRP